MWKLIEYIVPLIASLALIYELKNVLKVNIKIAFPIGYMFLALVTYLVYLFEIPIPLCFIIGGGIAIPIFIWHIKGNKFSIQKDDIVMGGIFVLLYTMVYIFDFERGFTHWDEMSHWGPMVKETLRLNQLYSVEASKLGFHKDYPPIIALFESIWCTLSLGYAERCIYRALHMMILSMLFAIAVPVEKIYKATSVWRKFIYGILVVPYIMVCTVFSLNDGDIFSTIYADGVLAITAAFCIYLILTLHDYTWIENAVQTIALSFLMLIKQIGFEYYLLCVLLLVFTLWLDYRKGINKRRLVCKAVCLSGIPILFKMSWSTYVNIHQLQGQFQISKIDFKIIKDIIVGDDVISWQYTGSKGYLHALLNRPLFSLGKFGVSYATMFCVGLIVYLFLIWYNKRKGINKCLWPMIIVYLAASIGHAAMMWITYMFCYIPGDFLELACYERYMNVIWLVNGIMLVFCSLEIFTNDIKVNSYNMSVIVISIIIIVWSNSGSVLKPILSNNSTLQEFYGICDYINTNVSEDSSIFIVIQRDNGYILSVFRYLTMPRTYNNDDYSFGEKYHEGDIWTRNYSQEEFLSKVETYDYLFLYNIDDQFIDGYGDVLIKENEEIIKIGDLYKILSTDEQGAYLSFISCYY